MIKNEVIWHIGKFEKAPFTAQTTVTLKVDESKRRLFARVHSAGHLLDICMSRAGRSDLKPSKGYHFATGAYVEYIGEVAEADRKPLVDKLNVLAKEIIDGYAKEKPVFKKICTYEEAGEQLCKAGGVPPYIP